MSVHRGRDGEVALECCILILLLSPRVVVALHKPKLLFDPASSFMLSSHSFVGVLQSSIFVLLFCIVLLPEERPPCGRHRHSLSPVWLYVLQPSTRSPHYQQLPMGLVDLVHHRKPPSLLLYSQPITVLFSSQPRKSSMSSAMAQRLIFRTPRQRTLRTHISRPR